MRTSVNERKTLKTRLATLTIRNLPRKCRKKDGHRDYLKYVRSIIPAKVVLAYTSDISKDRQRIEKERREFISSVNLVALSAGQNGANSRALDSGRNGVNLGRDEFSKQNGVSQSTNDESGIRGAKSCSSRI